MGTKSKRLTKNRFGDNYTLKLLTIDQNVCSYITKRLFPQFSLVPLIIHFRFSDELTLYIVIICCTSVSGDGINKVC